MRLIEIGSVAWILQVSLTAVFQKQTWACTRNKSNSSDTKILSSVLVSIFFALKAKLQVLKFEFSQIKLYKHKINLHLA